MTRVVSHPSLCGSVAGSASKLGVALHDAGYVELGLDFKYVAYGTDDIEMAVNGFRSLGFRGFGVSMPHKSEVIRLLDHASDDVSAIGACNTVVNDDGRLTGHNTDWRGAIDALAEAGCTNPSTAMVVGSGGVARAISYGLKQEGCKVWISARNGEAAASVVSDLDLEGWVSLEQQGEREVELIVNATPVSTATESPLKLDLHANANAFLDVVFAPKKTELVIMALEKGLKVAPGWRMLLHQALHQFKLYTGSEPPIGVMSKVLENAFD